MATILKDDEELIRVCSGCFHEVQLMGEDGIDVCVEGGCGIVESYTQYMTLSDYEDYHQ